MKRSTPDGAARIGATRTGAARSGWLLPLLAALSAAGAGVTGTLWWTQSHSTPEPEVAPAPVAAPSQKQWTPPGEAPSTPPGAAPFAGDAPFADTAPHEPPASLTANLTPEQAALTRGNWYYDHERWNDAIAQYRKAIASGLDNPNVRTDLGNCYRFAQQPQKALEQYRLAHRRAPQHEQSLFNQGGLYAFSLHQPDKAIAIWREYLRTFPQGQSVADARTLIARVQKQQKTAGP